MFDEYLEDELSEEPVIRRNSKFLKRAPAIDPYFEMEIEEDNPFTTKKLSWGNKHQFTFGENR